jgi:SAM-dependent methyltransferase
MKCPVCDGEEWQNVDKYRLKPQETHMCSGCGFVSYPTKYKSKEEILEYYRKDYRKPPNVTNLYSGERKLHYHESFLGPLFGAWKKDGKTKPVIGEVGAAYGVFLNWLKTYHFPEAELHGTELTTSFRRIAFHEYGLRLEEELPKKKYDMICSYHVLEHQQEPDKELAMYVDMLAPGGFVYLSTPIWFREAMNFGSSGFDIEYYWHPDHINAWSEEHLEAIIDKAGLQIVLKNDDIYGNTYLLQVKKDDSHKVFSFDPDKCLVQMERLYGAWQALQEGDTAMALEAWPNCPAAWITHYEISRASLHKLGFPAIQEFFEKAIAACPNGPEALSLAGDVSTRYEQYDIALTYLTRALQRKPNNPTVLMAMGNCFRQKALREKDLIKREQFFKESVNIGQFVRQTSLEVAGHATTFLYHDQAMLPFEGE